LDGVWRVRRISGLLPPLAGVRKRIQGNRGETRIGPLAVPFEIEDFTLNYTGILDGFSDLLDEITESRCLGRATFRGRVFARFEMSRISSPPPSVWSRSRHG
jgi:hypothetical protein